MTALLVLSAVATVCICVLALRDADRAEDDASRRYGDE